MKSRKSRADNEEVEISSGNVFADLGFQDAEERLLKAKLATKIAQLIEENGWTQAQTAEQTALDKPKVSHPNARPAFRIFTRPTLRRFESPGAQCGRLD